MLPRHTRHSTVSKTSIVSRFIIPPKNAKADIPTVFCAGSSKSIDLYKDSLRLRNESCSWKKTWIFSITSFISSNSRKLFLKLAEPLIIFLISSSLLSMWFWNESFWGAPFGTVYTSRSVMIMGLGISDLSKISDVPAILMLAARNSLFK